MLHIIKTMSVRIVSVGAPGIGKSYYLHTLTANYTSSLLIRPTVGVDFLTLRHNSMHVQIWDLSGRLEFQNLAKTYSKDVGVVLLWYKDAESLRELKETWMPLFKNKKRIICTTTSCMCHDARLTDSPLCLGTIYMDRHDARDQLIMIIKNKTDYIPPPISPKKCCCTMS
jgi:GTPase SAR1 family protein